MIAIMNYMKKFIIHPPPTNQYVEKLNRLVLFTPVSLCEVYIWMVWKFPECLVLKQCNIESVEQRRFSTITLSRSDFVLVPARAVIRVANTTEQIIFL